MKPTAAIIIRRLADDSQFVVFFRGNFFRTYRVSLSTVARVARVLAARGEFGGQRTYQGYISELVSL